MTIWWITEDRQFFWEGLTLTLYEPFGGGGGNEEGLCVLADGGDFETLITGDANAAVEQMLVKYRTLPDIELLVVGHHGSRSYTAEELLETLRPEAAVISVGYNNYGHPAPETVARLLDAGITVYRTDQCGNVTIRWRAG